MSDIRAIRMTQWEYKVVAIGPFADVDQTMSELGFAGWELVSSSMTVRGVTEYLLCSFKRPLRPIDEQFHV